MWHILLGSFTVKFTLTPARRGGQGGGGGTPNIKWYGWSEYFGGVEIFYSGYFFAWLGLSWEFLGYSKQSERKEPWERVWRNPGRIALRIKYNQTCWGSEILHGRFWALMFGPWIFWGFDFCPHSIIPDTWNPEYPPPPPPTLGAPNGSSTFYFCYVKNVVRSNKLTRCWPSKWKGSIY